MLEIKNISFSYGSHKVLDQVSLSVKAGEIHGILGVNGAGKTTLFQTIYGLLTPSNGEILFDKQNMNPSRIGYLETENHFYPYMKGREYLELLSHKNSQFDIDTWNNIFKLPLESIIETYSSGMKKKLALLGVISLDRPIMLLDEPFNGLDLESAEYFNLILKELKKKNNVIVLTSHILQVLKTNCDRISFLHGGTIQKTFTKENFEGIDGTLRTTITQDSASILHKIFE